MSEKDSSDNNYKIRPQGIVLDSRQFVARAPNAVRIRNNWLSAVAESRNANASESGLSSGNNDGRHSLGPQHQAPGLQGAVGAVTREEIAQASLNTELRARCENLQKECESLKKEGDALRGKFEEIIKNIHDQKSEIQILKSEINHRPTKAIVLIWGGLAIGIVISGLVVVPPLQEALSSRNSSRGQISPAGSLSHPQTVSPVQPAPTTPATPFSRDGGPRN